ncbi:type 1 glutamine amidotransferase [Pelagicoccus mobilis]|uniref:Type 1 glutamine amidotransferase n=1 Tax=Pelagicoccus mobilis TaxID=415221 RepID=A0A934RTG8_9BACT|nr:type 1 glutamine amidotransferase [Pelagicoccus mobilis]MBK1877285.1 type 1 glutamine amidotransferase [Pelagicoccus mobilis]
MAKLLIVDPLDLALESEGGAPVWSSRSCFEASLGEMEGLVCHYTTAKDPELCRIALGADAVILGGSEESAWQDTVFNDHLLDLIAICKNGRIPLLAICYGSQLLGRALGGHVSRHPDGIELGAPAIRITEKGKRHPLFKGIQGGCIWSVETHNDAVMTLPPGCDLLASTDHTPVQAFSYGGLLTGVQFHPEMNGDDLRFLWEAFERKGFVDSVPEEYRRKIDACECDRILPILRNFAEMALASPSPRNAVL